MLRRCGETFVSSFAELARPSCRCRCAHGLQTYRLLPRSKLPLRQVGLACSPLLSRPRFFSESSISLERQLEDFQGSLKEPEQIRIDGPDARRKFGLSSSDLEELGQRYIEKESPYEAIKHRPIKQFMLPDIVDLAMRKRGEEQILSHYERYLRRVEGGDPSAVMSKIYGIDEESELQRSVWAAKLPGRKARWYSAPSTTTVEGQDSVRQGLISNSIICVIKGGVWLYTGSHSIFADLMHSSADVANYAYRFSQLSGTLRSRDLHHPYGYAPLRYITADRSFVILGGLGFVVPFCLGVAELSHHWASGTGCIAFGSGLDAVLSPVAIFLASIALEGLALRTAYLEIKDLAIRSGIGDDEDTSPAFVKDWRRCYAYLQEGADTMSIATFCEAGSGVLGSSVGLVGLGLSWHYLDGVYDVGASLLMASIVGVVSAFLLRRSGSALLGRTLPFKRVEGLVGRLEERSTILNIYDVKTEVIGTDTVRFKAEVQFNPQAITKKILGRRRVYAERGSTGDLQGASTHGAKLGAELELLLPKLRQGFSSKPASEAWLFANNALFYEALAWELKKAERMLKRDLKDFRNVHIDLETW